MSYITREDGEHFVVPSYRDVLTVKQKSQLKKEVLLLSKSYGDYVAIQKKNITQYEVAYSPDTGYLLGESIWHQFKKPLDLVYCEVIPNTTEAILVIVKAGSVYLDGSFPLDSIPEELIIFLTQQNNFEIYIYGDVPISQEPVAGKFSFEAASVKSFTVLDKPVFPKLPLLKIYQLKLVDTVLKDLGVGAIPIKPILMLILLAGLAWGGYELLKPAPPPPEPPPVNPFQGFLDSLQTASPDEEISKLSSSITSLLQISGWSVKSISYGNGSFTAAVLSNGGTMQQLNAWCKLHEATILIMSNGISLSMNLNVTTRPVPNKIYPNKKVLEDIIDKIAKVLPGNTLALGTSERGSAFSTTEITINLAEVTPAILDLIGKQLSGLPLVLNSVNATIDENGTLTGSIVLKALGS